jgi:predicted ATPase
MPFSAGDKLGPYEILTPLGAGGMGEVYRARDTRLGRSVAIKILPRAFSADHEGLHRFEREARLASALNHPNIVTILELGQDGSIHYIAMELVNGKTLAELVASGALPIRNAIELATQVAEGLAKAHEAGIAHRDLKPGNLMVSDDGFVKILDFGLAKLAAPSGAVSDTRSISGWRSQPGQMMGTPQYMSPEQASGGPADFRSDQFSFGLVLYEMVTGKHPFKRSTPAETLVAILREQAEPVGAQNLDAPAPLCRAIERCLAKEPDRRYVSTRDLAHELAAIRDHFAGKPIQRVETRPTNIPVQRTRFVGREKEVAAARELLLRQDVRMVTITGPGGIGKTRLAVEVASGLVERFPGGTHFIPLAALSDSGLIASVIVQTLGIREAGVTSPLEMLKKNLQDSLRAPMLLLLDNFEHLIRAAPTVAELLAVTPHLKILVTSRAALHVYGEHEFPAPPLRLPDTRSTPSLDVLSQYSAVALFVQRAVAATPGFELNLENARSIIEICARLDGLPLAIELAAARLKVLSPSSLLTRLASRLHLLTGGARDLPQRQQTLRATMDWSYDLLSPAEQKLFRRLSVFVGGCNLEGVEAVCYTKSDLDVDLLDGMASFVDKSLLQQFEQANGESRFLMLETIREYALEKLEASGEPEQMQRHHAAFFLAFAEEAEPHLHGRKPAEWLKRLEEEHANIRAALRWSLAYDAGVAARLGAAIRYFWVFQGHLAEGLALSQDILRLCDRAPSAVRGNLLSMAGNLAKFQGDYETARRMYEEGLSDGRSAHDLRQVSLSCRGLGGLAYEQGDYPTAREFEEEALDAARQSNDRFGIARSLSMLGDLARSQGDDAAARPLYEEALAICRQLDRTYSTANILTNLAAAEFGDGNYTAAYSHFTEGLRMHRESDDEIIGGKIDISYALDGLAALAVLRGETELAAKLAGAADQLRESMNYNVEPAERRLRDTYLASLHTVLSEDDFSRAYGQGRRLKLHEGVALALGKKPD